MIPTIKILIVEDDSALSKRLSRALTMSHYQVDIADVVSGLGLARRGNYDLALLDLSLSELESIDFCRRLRSESREILILLLSAEEAVAKRITGIKDGADSYVTKPLDIDKLLVTVRSVFHHKQLQISPLIAWSNVYLDPKSYEVFCQDQRLRLTSKEYAILELLLHNPHQVFSLNTLIEWLWPIEGAPSNNRLRGYIESLQHKLKQAGIEGMIETVDELGYRLGNLNSYQLQTVSASAHSTRIERNSKTALEYLEPSGLGSKSLDPLRAAWERHCLKYLELAVSLSEVIPFLQAQDSGHLDEQHRALDAKAKDKKTTDSRVITNETEKNAALRRSRAAIHTLKGTLGSFGLNRASQIASQIESYLRMTSPLTTKQIDQLEMLINSLKQSLVRFETDETDASIPNSSTLESSISASVDNLAPATFATYPSPSSNSVSVTKSAMDNLDTFYPPLLGHQSLVYDWLIIDSDRQMTGSLLHQASILGIYPQVAHSLAEAQRRLAQQVPNVVTFDPNCAASWDEGIAFLADLTREYPALPILVISEQDSLAARVNVVRSGGCIFLHKPVDIAQILDTVGHTVTKQASSDVRIVALDDNLETLHHLQSLLGPWGFQLTLLSEPTQFWQALEKTLPDLLILDLEMPQFNGLELCQVIRSDPRTAQIPILFLSAHTAPEVVRGVFEAGADDYICKPVSGPELIGRILNRLERQRFLRELAEIDSLTGLSRRRQSEDTLERLLRLSIRQGVPLCMALLDLDHFKQINDCYGHDVGDQVLKIFGEYLRNAFRGEDVVARWGGEEFMVGLYNVSKERSLQRLNTLRERFGQYLFQVKSSALNRLDLPLQFQVSLSGGMVTAPADGETVETLYRHADRALYRAKAAGRDQICTFSQ